MVDSNGSGVLARTADERRGTYASAAILARRARLLELAREQIAEKGYANFSIKEIGERAGVSKQTIYNIFQSKERLIAKAIWHAFDLVERRSFYVNRPGTMERVIERNVLSGRRVSSVLNYMSVLVSIYFDPDGDADIRQAIHRAGTYAHDKWIKALAEVGELLPRVDADTLIDDVASVGYLHILQRCRGEVEDDAFVQRRVEASLSMVAVAAAPKTRAEIEARLDEIAFAGLRRYPGEDAQLRSAEVVASPGSNIS